MKMKKVLAALLISSGVLLGGCGEDAADPDPLEEMESVEEAESVKDTLASMYDELETDSTFQTLEVERYTELGEDVLIIESEDLERHIYQKVDGVFEYIGTEDNAEFKEELLVERSTRLPDSPSKTEQGLELLKEYQGNLEDEELAKRILNTTFESLDEDQNYGIQFAISQNLMLINLEQGDNEEALTYLYNMLDMDSTDSGVLRTADLETYLYLKMGKAGETLYHLQNDFKDPYYSTPSFMERAERLYSEILNSENLDEAVKLLEEDEILKNSTKMSTYFEEL